MRSEQRREWLLDGVGKARQTHQRGTLRKDNDRRPGEQLSNLTVPAHIGAGYIIANMGKTERRQAKLQFEQHKTVRHVHKNALDSEDRSTDTSQEEIDMKTQVAMKGSLASIESKIDSVCSRLDVMAQKLEKHDGRLQEGKQRISQIEDSGNSQKAQLSNMDKVLKLIPTKRKI
ncbi:hypothetical protein NDU88_003542 [Pleurodeles waltl]|uniref:t-SNARE coiled-coil homology domain-containing protein n=1 Tax=Pleurodeles waltl TaxID=8319 RepID=A0AAV7QA15_PLEWA|nr:hypothetical protein NDU88_003542 [Pleurodeles waltl]